MPRYIIGADEVGRGSLAGPVVVGAVLVPTDMAPIPGVRDSKKLSAKQRDRIAEILKAEERLGYSIESRPAEYIDQHGIAESLFQCFQGAIARLLLQTISPLYPQFYADGRQNVEVLIDGRPIPKLAWMDTTIRFIVKGDDKEWSIGAASIIAKVWRDQYMIQASDNHPGYDWSNNVGYGTARHIEAIKAKGLTDMHRRSFCTKFVRCPKGVPLIENPFFLIAED